MDQNNNFHQYGYDNYLKAPTKQRERAGIGGSLFRRFQNPAFATAALLLAGVVFAAIIVMAYPSGNNDREIPIVKADLRPVKSEPVERGGMEIPYQDSTILAEVGQETTSTTIPQVENLLEPQPSEETLSKEEALTRAMADTSPAAGEDPPAGALEPTTGGDVKVKVVSLDAEATEDDSSAILQKIEVPPLPETSSIGTETAAAETTAAERASAKSSDKMRAAATSPETLEFVRDVLDKKDQAAASGIASKEAAVEAPPAPVLVPTPSPAPAKTIEEKTLNDISPSMGAAQRPVTAVTPGTYFVQVASVPARDRADAQWKTLQKTYSNLGGLDYRVQEANLGDRGVFYRIQAGPMSKESASSICDSIKASRPGGCLVVKQ